MGGCEDARVGEVFDCEIQARLRDVNLGGHVDNVEMRFVAFQPFLVRMWVGHVGRSSMSVSYELRVAPDQPPAIVAESSVVFWDPAAGSSWAISDEVRATLASYTGAPVALRERPGR